MTTIEHEAAERLWRGEPATLSGVVYRLERLPVSGRYVLTADGIRANAEWRDDAPTVDGIAAALARIADDHRPGDTLPGESRDVEALAVVDGIGYAPGGAFAACSAKAANVRGIVDTYRWEHDSGASTETVLVDLLADLTHYAALLGEDWSAIVEQAATHVEAERRGE